MKTKNKIFVLWGKSASGKTTIEKMLKEQGFKNLVSYTTRAKRDYEIDGDDYHFISPEDFNKKSFIAKYVVSDTWKYGIAAEDIAGIRIFSIISESYLNELSQSADVSLIYFNVPEDVRRARLIERGESEESISKRFEIEAKEGNPDFSLVSSMVEIGNEDIDSVFQKVLNFIKEDL